MPPMSSWEKIVLCSSDREIFTVEPKVMLHSEVIKNIVTDAAGHEDTPIPLLNVDAKTLKKVIEYCKMHTHFEGSEDDLKPWDNEFVNVDPDALYDLLMAANFLEIRSLLDLLVQAVANRIKGKTVEEIRKNFNIVDHGFTPDEQVELRQEHPGFFEEKI